MNEELRIKELYEERERLQNTDLPSTPEAMNFYTERVREINNKIRELRNNQLA